MPQISFSRSYCWQIVVLWLQPQNQTTATSQWKTATSPHQNKHQASSEIKYQDNAHLLFDVRGMVRLEFIPLGHTVNQGFCLELLTLCNSAQQKRHNLWCMDNWFSHHEKCNCSHIYLNWQIFNKKTAWLPCPTRLFTWFSSTQHILFPQMKRERTTWNKNVLLTWIRWRKKQGGSCQASQQTNF